LTPLQGSANTSQHSNRWLAQALVLIVGLLIIVGGIVAVLLLSGKDPASALNLFLQGSLGDATQRSLVVMRGLPILLAASGLLLTFSAGLWNIGIEGQMMFGAIFATIIARSVGNDTSGWIALALELILAAIGGALWALVAGVLKTKGRVNEIFGGVALNFIASNIALYILDGPWKYGARQQTAPFNAPALLPLVPDSGALSLPGILIAIAGFVLVYLILKRSRWGLQLRAMGHSQRSAFLLGVRTERNVLLAMMACGALGGIGGALQILSPDPVSKGYLFPDSSGGIGFLALLVVLLANYQAAWVPLISLFFSLVPVGMLNLQTQIGLDPTLGRVFEEALVFIVVLANGAAARARHTMGEPD